MSLAGLPAGWTHWLHEPVSGFLARYNALRPAGILAYPNLEVQVFITHHQRRVLLFQVRGTNTWTAPSVVVPANETRSLCQITLDIFQNAVEERALPDLQFLDHPVQLQRLEVDWNAPSKAMVKIMLSTANPSIDKSTAINCPTRFSDIKWLDLTSSGAGLTLTNLPIGRLQNVRDLMAFSQQEHRRLHQTGGRDLRTLYYNIIKSAVKTKSVDLSERITHALVALSTTGDDILYLLNADAEMLRDVTQNGNWQIQTPKAKPGGGFKTLKYNIVGSFSGGRVQMSEVYVTPEMLLPDCRIAIEWIQETALTKLVPGPAPVQEGN